MKSFPFMSIMFAAVVGLLYAPALASASVPVAELSAAPATVSHARSDDFPAAVASATEIGGATVSDARSDDFPAAGMLENEYAESKEAFVVGGEWFPYPAYSDRDGWNSFFGDSRVEVVKAGELYKDFKWHSLPASCYIAYDKTGDRAPMELKMKENRVALNALIFAELAEGKGRFIPDIIDGVWQFCQYPSWVLSAHQFRQPSRKALPYAGYRFIDLNSCAVGVQIAVVWHFFHEIFDTIDPSISLTLRDAVKENILDPYLDASKYESNWWLGFKLKPGMVVNNWNPWCNSDVILTFLLMESDQSRLNEAIAQAVRSVDIFMSYIKSDGACEEGPAYWGHCAGKLYDFIRILHSASSGAFNLFDNPRIKAMGEYVAASYVGDGWVVNFADATARLELPSVLIYNYGKSVGSEAMEDFALYLNADNASSTFVTPIEKSYCSLHRTLKDNGIANTNNTVVDELIDLYRLISMFSVLPEMTEKINGFNASRSSLKDSDRTASNGSGKASPASRSSSDIFNKASTASRPSSDIFNKTLTELRSTASDFVWYPKTQFCYMKNKKGWFFAGKGGNNNESHNHNDIGSFILYVDNVPVFIDAGVGTYTAKTFSKDRYTIWSMQSDWHNLPSVNGVSQSFGAQYKAKDVRVEYSPSAHSGTFSLDIAGAYRDDALCKSWTRSFYMSDGGLTISDSYVLSERKSNDCERFMVQGEVYLPGCTVGGDKVKNGEVVIVNGGVAVKLSYPKSMTVSVEKRELDDPRLVNVWGTELRRISLTSHDNAPLKGKYIFKVSRLR